MWLQEKSFFKKGSNEQKPWVEQKAGYKQIEDKLLELYYANFSGIDDLHRKLRENGYTVSKAKIKEILQKQNIYSLHHPSYHTFERRRVYIHSIDEQWQADLVDMQQYKKENNNFNYILTVIDCFSKYAWCIPLKNKMGKEIINAFTDLFKNRKPKKLQTDKGKEFVMKNVQVFLKSHEIHWFSSESELKAQIVERFNRTIKEKLWKHFTYNNTKRWIDVLPSLVDNYNKSYHRSIKMKPIEASRKENENRVYKNLFPDIHSQTTKHKFNVGDLVRINKKKSVFDKGYLPNYTTEIFQIATVKQTTPITYELSDKSGELIIGAFYEKELSKVIDL